MFIDTENINAKVIIETLEHKIVYIDESKVHGPSHNIELQIAEGESKNAGVGNGEIAVHVVLGPILEGKV